MLQNVLPLTVEQMAGFDNGTLAKVIEQKLAMCAEDCMSRPGLKKPRKLQIEFTFEPVATTNGEHITCEKVKMAYQVKATTPATKVQDHELRPTKGGFAFNRDFPDEYDQSSLYAE